MVEQPKKEKKQLNNYIYFSSISIQMIAIVLGGTYLGVYIDSIFNLSSSVFTISFSLFSVVAAVFFVYKKVSWCKKVFFIILLYFFNILLACYFDRLISVFQIRLIHTFLFSLISFKRTDLQSPCFKEN